MANTLHPGLWWLWSLSLAIELAKANSVLTTCIAIAFMGLLVLTSTQSSPWSGSYWVALKLGTWIIAIRLCMAIFVGVPYPGRTLFTLPQISFPGWMSGIHLGGVVTAERLSITFHEAFVMAGVIACFGVATSLTSPHRVLRSIPVMFYEFGVAVVIATSLIPQFVASITRIRQAQKLRGQSGGSLRNWKKIAIPLLEESLARALNLAASMDSRGYGFSRKRSRYRIQRWQITEYAIALLSIIALVTPGWMIYIAMISPLIRKRNFSLAFNT
jgi:energy-coupling factor transport system permease protein